MLVAVTFSEAGLDVAGPFFRFNPRGGIWIESVTAKDELRND